MSANRRFSPSMQPVAGLRDPAGHPVSVPGPEMAGGMAQFRGGCQSAPPVRSPIGRKSIRNDGYDH